MRDSESETQTVLEPRDTVPSPRNASSAVSPRVAPFGESSDQKRAVKSDQEVPTSVDPQAAPSVYTNLIIVEHALRSQYVELQRSRRRGLIFFWGVVLGAVLLTWRVRYNASLYRPIRLMEQVVMIALYISIGLFFLTGMYRKVFSVAPRFLADTNKGLKSLNFRLVKNRTSLKEKLFRLVNPIYSDDPAGPVKLVLSTREFAPHYIEEWEVFRDEYWERQRRRRLRNKGRRKEKR